MYHNMTERITAREVKEILERDYSELNISVRSDPELDIFGNVIYTNIVIFIPCLNENIYNSVLERIKMEGWIKIVVGLATVNSRFNTTLDEDNHVIILKGIQ